ncbi:DinB family protein [Bacillus sp. AFS017336]|uniref:DinB family protein n=1 Tax=Bacillus sp. AFS017336 TaxID=2033489 RepID=UPI000BF11BFE|nr:DinB family protein [Bacillus sp. AFS017336]PEL10547.1 damage-inducible protein DinB [Bacillus sp. AFS017336]
MYVENVINQLCLSVKTVFEMLELITEEDLNFRPIDDKKSIGELAQHLCELIGADLKIMSGVSQEAMVVYYSEVQCTSLIEMKKLLQKNFHDLKENYLKMNGQDLFEEVTSYWELKYSKFEWLLEILVHFTHHRAQLHTLLVQKKGKINIALF